MVGEVNVTIQLLTKNIPFLQGYQGNLCFYCAEKIEEGNCHVDHVLPMALEVHRARHVQVLTSRLNVFLRSWIGRRAPPSRRGRIARFKYATQSGVAPPQFTLFFSNPESIHRSYRRYLENGLRDEYGFNGTPVQVKLRAS